MHCRLFNDIHFVRSEALTMPTKDPLILNNTINTCLTSHNILQYYSYALNTSENLIYQVYQ